MVPTIAPLVVALLALSLIAGAAVLSRRRRRGRVRRVFVGPDAASTARVGLEMTLPVGQREERVRVASVDPRGWLEVELLPPTTAAGRGADPKEAALLRALGFDPATHDLRWPPHGIQVMRNGEKVRFFTQRQVRELGNAWKTALRAERAGGAA